jgi:hypothetical protein
VNEKTFFIKRENMKIPFEIKYQSQQLRARGVAGLIDLLIDLLRN